MIAAAEPTRGTRRTTLAVAAAAAASALVVLTLRHYGVTALGAAWSGAQLLLVFVAAFDVMTRRIPNRVTAPAALVVLALRAAFEHSTLPAAAAAGAIAFGAFFLFALLTRGGIGMGDVKLVGLLGLLLGKAVLPALLLGVVAGGIGSLVVLVARSGGRGHTFAYGPYLCLGAALGILAFGPPPLV